MAIAVQFNRRTAPLVLEIIGAQRPLRHRREFKVKSASSAYPTSASSYQNKSIFVSPSHSVLHDVFGYEQFRGPQEAIVEHVIGGGDALVLMPTGGGKSLCYQVPAIVRHDAGRGVAIVVSPLIALMHDQVGALHEAGVSAAFLNSTLDWQQTQDVERCCTPRPSG
jgi:superfamily II DNA helicase RecQ